MLPVLLGEQGDKPVRPYLLQQTISLALSIRQGHWKLLDHQGSGGNDYERNVALRRIRTAGTRARRARPAVRPRRRSWRDSKPVPRAPGNRRELKAAAGGVKVKPAQPRVTWIGFYTPKPVPLELAFVW